MELKFILGPAGSGKSHMLRQEVINGSIVDPESEFLVIIPDQATQDTIGQILKEHPKHGAFNIDALGFNRLAHRVFDELNIHPNQVLQEFGKSMVIKKILFEQRKNLSVYGGYYNKLGFVEEMKSMISELYQYGVAPEDLGKILEKLGDALVQDGDVVNDASGDAQEDAKDDDTNGASHQTPNPVTAKIDDIKLIYEKFQEFLGDNYIVAEELTELLGVHAGESELLRKSHLFFDGFTGFTPIQFNLLKQLMPVVKSMTFAFSLDESDQNFAKPKDHELFYMTKHTVNKLNAIADEVGVTERANVFVSAGENSRFAGNAELEFLENNLYRTCGKSYNKPLENIKLVAAEGVKSEATFVASEIRRLVRDENYRYKDIGVLSGDLANSGYVFKNVFEEYDIPVFIDSSISLKSNPCSDVIRSILSIFVEDFSYDSIFRFLKSGMTSMTNDEIECLENYAIMRGIRGYRRWNTDVPKTVEAKFTMPVNSYRAEFMAMVADVRTALKKKSSTARDYVEALYDFLVNLGIYEKLMTHAESLKEEGLLAEASFYKQIFEKTVALFDKIIELIGDVTMSLEEFYEIVDTGLKDVAVGIAPQDMDHVVMGDIMRSRMNNIKVLFFVSVNDGIVPKPAKKGKLINDRDRATLASVGLELAPDEKMSAFVEQFNIYCAINKPSEKLYISYRRLNEEMKNSEPSYLVSRFKSLFTELNAEVFKVGHKEIDVVGDALHSYIESLDTITPDDVIQNVLRNLGFEQEVVCADAGNNFTNGVPTIQDDTLIRGLYGLDQNPDMLSTSVSKLELYAKCPYSFFLQYGLGLKERETSELNNMETGIIFHAILEKVFAEVRGACGNDWENLPLDGPGGLEDIVNKKTAEVLAQEDYSILKETKRNEHKKEIVRNTAMRTVKNLREQMLKCTMRPLMLEYRFDTEKDNINDFVFDLPNGMKMKLTGTIDRVDSVTVNVNGTDNVYTRVIDYKSSDKKINAKAVLSEFQLQLMVYSAVAVELCKNKFPNNNVINAGMFNYNFANKLGDVECSMDETEKLKENYFKGNKLRGFVNADNIAKEQLQSSGNIKETITISDRDPLVDAKLQELEDNTKENIQELGDSIVQGKIALEPLGPKKDDAHCKVCSYKSICRFNAKFKDNIYRHPDNTKLAGFTKK